MMAPGSPFFLLTTIAIVLLLVLSECYSYPSFRELPGRNRQIRFPMMLLFFSLSLALVLVGGRPMKLYSSNGSDRYLNRVGSSDSQIFLIRNSSVFHLDETILWNNGTTSTLASRTFRIRWSWQRWNTRYIMDEFHLIIRCWFFALNRYISARRSITR